MLFRATLIWLVLVVLAVTNGAVREALISPYLGDYAGHLISTALLASLILVTAWLSIPWIGPPSVRHAWTVGALWMLLTVAFEFLAGHYLFGNSWERLLADYNLLRGRVWPVVLVASLLAPPWAHRVRAK
jgi:hypothetical protein